MRINMGMISMEFLEQNRYHRYQLVKSMDENSSRMTISNKLHPYILYLSFYRLICIKWTQQSDTYLQILRSIKTENEFLSKLNYRFSEQFQNQKLRIFLIPRSLPLRNITSTSKSTKKINKKNSRNTRQTKPKIDFTPLKKISFLHLDQAGPRRFLDRFEKKSGSRFREGRN